MEKIKNKKSLECVTVNFQTITKLLFLKCLLEIGGKKISLNYQLFNYSVSTYDWLRESMYTLNFYQTEW
jgi:hypothetical protein